MNNFVVEIWKKFDLDTDISVVFKPNKVLTSQKILGPILYIKKYHILYKAEV